MPGFEVPLGAAAQVPLEKRFDERIYERAKELLEDRDRNKNGTIEGDELTRNNWEPPAEQSDLNKDGALNLEELCYRYQARSGGSSQGGSNGGRVPVPVIPPPLFPTTPQSRAARPRLVRPAATSISVVWPRIGWPGWT